MFVRAMMQVCPLCCVRFVATFAPERVVVVHKTSRLDFERQRNSKHVEGERKSCAVSDSCLEERHAVHQSSLDEIHKFLSSQGLDVRDRNRETYSKADVHWADTIISAGGDGNFLFTASKVFTPEKLIVGINTDPSRSEGFLCLPSSHGVRKSLIKLFQGLCSPGVRNRARVVLNGNTLPVRALNEVFIGEKNHSHATFYDVECDSNITESQKSSGLIVYTGTGSTSWAYNVNKITTSVVDKIFNIARSEGLVVQDVSKEKVTQLYNNSNVFDAADVHLAFTAREPIVRGIYAACKTHGYVKRIQVKARSWNTAVVIDGQFEYDVPYGSELLCYIDSRDALTTIPA